MTDPATARLDPIIRPATDDDVSAIDTLMDGHDAVSNAPPLRPGIRAAHLRQQLRWGEVLVAEIDTRIVGFGGTVDTGRAVNLADLFVDRAFLGRGIGTGSCRSSFATDGRGRRSRPTIPGRCRSTCGPA